MLQTWFCSVGILAVVTIIREHIDKGSVCSRPLQDSPATLNTQLYIQLYERKLARFQQFAVLYPEYCWVFVGDNGQARPALIPTRSFPPGFARR